MRAAIRCEYGPPEVLRVEEIETPSPLEDEVLVRVHAASVNLGDWELLTGEPRWIAFLANLFGKKSKHPVVPVNGSSLRAEEVARMRYPILGTDIAGRVEAVGAKVTQFRVGDEVFGECATNGFGAFAEYVCVPEKATLVPKPAWMSFEEAAAMPQAGAIALKGIRDLAGVQAGQRVLVNGAGGGAGTFSVQLAKARGAEVTGVDGPTKLDMLRSIGADHVIDYTRESYLENGERYDVILDMAAYVSVFESRRSLSPGGIYLMGGGGGQATWQAAFLGPILSRTGPSRIAFLLADSKREDLLAMIELIEAGAARSIIDRVYPLDEAAEALRRIGEKQSLGKVIVTP